MADPSPQPLLDDDAIAEALSAMPGWERDGRTLVYEKRFDDFASAFAFATKVAEIADAHWHHPDLEVGWGRTRVTLTTHDAGGVTALDLALARAIGPS